MRALALGIDRENIVNTVLMGHGRVANSFYGSETGSEKPEIQPPSYDPVKGRMLLEAAGWEKNEADGLFYRDKRPLEFTMIYPLENPVEKQVAEFIKLSLYDLGAKVFLSPVTHDSLVGAIHFNNDFQSALLELAATSTNQPESFQHYVPKNGSCAAFGCFADDRITSLYREAQRETDSETRKRKIHELARLLSDLQPTVALFHKVDFDLISKRVQTHYPRMSTIFDIHHLYGATLRN